MSLFRITEEPIEDRIRLTDAAAGGFAVFEGRVRNHNEDRPVLALEYESYAELAEKEGEKILAEARERYPIEDAWCAHRVGRLEIGDVAVRVEVAAAHRQAAFSACRYIIDEVKSRVPIWKKEHYADGPTEWLNCHDEAPVLTPQIYYARQTRVSGFGEQGQRRLGESRVLVVGAGGLGSAVLPSLVAAGVGRVTVVDGDVVDPSNLHRQVLYGTGDVGRPKVEAAAERLRGLNPFVTVEPLRTRVSAANVQDLVKEVDLVIDCTDNFATKFQLNDACVQARVRLVQASIYQFEGQVHLYDPNDDQSACLRCLWPETPAEGCVGSCAEVGVLGFVPAVFGALQSAEVVKALVGVGDLLSREMLVMDLLTMETSRLRRKRNLGCPVCGPEARIELTDLQPWEASAFDDFVVVDIREPEEVAEEPLPIQEVLLSPMDVFDPHDARWKDRRVLLVCRSGNRSGLLAERLHSEGHRRFFSLSGGLIKLKEH